MPAATIKLLHTTPVKGLRVVARDAVQLTTTGTDENRRFYLIDDRARMINGKRLGTLNEIVADYEHTTRRLALTFPDGTRVSGEVECGERVTTRFYSRPAQAHELLGPFSAALSAHIGQPIRLVEGIDRSGIDRGRGGSVSIVSQASIDALARAAGTTTVDPRRFRMLVVAAGLEEPHEEDTWVGERLRIGEALVRVRGHVGRCNVTHRDPESGTEDLPTLDILRGYRSGLETTEPLAFGVYGEVLTPGRIAVGDSLALL